MARARCQAMVPAGTYRQPGRCEKRHGVKPLTIQEGADKLRVKLCVPHRKIIDAHKPLEFAP